MTPLLRSVLVLAASAALAVPALAQDEDDRFDGEAFPRPVARPEPEKKEDRSLEARIHRFGERLAELLADRELPADRASATSKIYERTCRAALGNPDELRRVYQERLFGLRSRLGAEGASGEEIEKRLEATRQFYETWLSRRTPAMSLPEPRK